mmetsp:Transcript_30047/g.47989  ORF Transcript_30047/g.47989 Transcript_30047/m.47989 type:complete len:683 (-) Transcript_30047:1075-3123(-)
MQVDHGRCGQLFLSISIFAECLLLRMDGWSDTDLHLNIFFLFFLLIIVCMLMMMPFLVAINIHAILFFFFFFLELLLFFLFLVIVIAFVAVVVVVEMMNVSVIVVEHEFVPILVLFKVVELGDCVVVVLLLRVEQQQLILVHHDMKRRQVRQDELAHIVAKDFVQQVGSQLRGHQILIQLLDVMHHLLLNVVLRRKVIRRKIQHAVIMNVARNPRKLANQRKQAQQQADEQRIQRDQHILQHLQRIEVDGVDVVIHKQNVREQRKQELRQNVERQHNEEAKPLEHELQFLISEMNRAGAVGFGVLAQRAPFLHNVVVVICKDEVVKRDSSRRVIAQLIVAHIVEEVRLQRALQKFVQFATLSVLRQNVVHRAQSDQRVLFHRPRNLEFRLNLLFEFLLFLLSQSVRIQATATALVVRARLVSFAFFDFVAAVGQRVQFNLQLSRIQLVDGDLVVVLLVGFIEHDIWQTVLRLIRRFGELNDGLNVSALSVTDIERLFMRRWRRWWLWRHCFMMHLCFVGRVCGRQRIDDDHGGRIRRRLVCGRRGSGVIRRIRRIRRTRRPRGIARRTRAHRRVTVVAVSFHVVMVVGAGRRVVIVRVVEIERRVRMQQEIEHIFPQIPVNRQEARSVELVNHKRNQRERGNVEQHNHQRPHAQHQQAQQGRKHNLRHDFVFETQFALHKLP